MSLFPKIFLKFLNKNTKDFSSPNVFLEQYSTPITVLEEIFSLGIDFKNKTVLDLGVGLGNLSFCSAWLGAKNIVGIDSDDKLIRTLISNEKKFLEIYTQFKIKTTSQKKMSSEQKTDWNYPIFSWVHSQVEFFPLMKFKNYFDIAIMNPPFGTRRSGIDFVFLQRATQLSCPIISLHKKSKNLELIIKKLLKKCNYEVETIKSISFPLEKTMTFHTKLVKEIEIKIIKSKPIK